MAKVMIVDDEKDVVTLVRFLMEKDGYEVTDACNGADALDKLGIDPPKADVVLPDVIILDIMMPVMDGYTMQTKLQENEKAKKIPLIVLTAKGQMRDVFQHASTAFVEKPFDPKSLRDLVKKTLDIK